MMYWHMIQHGEILKTCLVKEAIHKRPHTGIPGDTTGLVADHHNEIFLFPSAYKNYVYCTVV